jgi:hypothetical protein
MITLLTGFYLISKKINKKFSFQGNELSIQEGKIHFEFTIFDGLHIYQE